MTSSTSPGKLARVLRVWPVVAWLLIWQGLSMYIGHEVLLVSPVTVARRLAQLVGEAVFWSSVFFSLRRIAFGFLLAAVTGVLFAALAARFRRIEEFLAPVVVLFKSTPVASFTILALIWVSSRNLSVLVSYLMVMPIVYTNVLNGIKSANPKLLEMADVFGIPAGRRIAYIYVSQVLPFFQSACLVGLGLCWKAGIAAEVIGIPGGSIGEKLYMAKVYLATPDLFAWTLTIICVSVVFERLFMLLVRLLITRLERL
ncbi:MAG: ABC transporter permease subunit [Oscillospiraceae bacterium]|nr:ABC transporter permease subunit [Oscillospiraceae bacterium]